MPSLDIHQRVRGPHMPSHMTDPSDPHPALVAFPKRPTKSLALDLLEKRLVERLADVAAAAVARAVGADPDVHAAGRRGGGSGGWGWREAGEVLFK